MTIHDHPCMTIHDLTRPTMTYYQALVLCQDLSKSKPKIIVNFHLIPRLDPIDSKSSLIQYLSKIFNQ